jgi:hypothetical protein
MTPEQFCYWLQGRAELMPETPPTAAEWKMIAEHLATTFKKVTPPMDQFLKQLGPAKAHGPVDPNFGFGKAYDPFGPGRMAPIVKDGVLTC